MYIEIPKTIDFKKLKNESSFSPNNFKEFIITNKNVKRLGDLLLDKKKGKEVGSLAYIPKSKYYFIKTKALQTHYYLPILNNKNCATPILPEAFIESNLEIGDILIAKDSKVGEVTYINENIPQYMLSGGLVKLKITESLRYYLFAVMKSNFFKDQLNIMISRGATIKHAKSLWEDVKIPFPNENEDEIFEYITLLVKSIIRKEEKIKANHEELMELIQEEVENNQFKTKFNYEYPLFSDLNKLKRLNAGIYSEYFKKQEYKIKNYIPGYKSIKDYGFEVSRGQNLQVSCIGKSIYSDDEKSNFYTLILPKNLSVYGLVNKYEYLGNPNSLKTLKMGDIIFGAEGFEKGRSIIILNDEEDTITNIHGITLNHSDNDITLSIFIKCFLDYLRRIGLVDLYAVGGNGGSLAITYWDIIPIPNFPETKKEEIIKLYYNEMEYSGSNLNLNSFESYDKSLTDLLGIWQLGEQINVIKKRLEMLVHDISQDKKINISFDFLQ